MGELYDNLLPEVKMYWEQWIFYYLQPIIVPFAISLVNEKLLSKEMPYLKFELRNQKKSMKYLWIQTKIII